MISAIFFTLGCLVGLFIKSRKKTKKDVLFVRVPAPRNQV